jgi:hypothetical protein
MIKFRPGISRIERSGAGASAGRRWRQGVVAMLLLALALEASPVAADPYDPKAAGHPVRIAAYIMHPVGVLLDYLILRPAHWLGSKEPIRTLVGHTD